jgi:hypothetical protein
MNMKNLIVLLMATLVAAGCSQTLPVAPPLPDAPKQEPLAPIDTPQADGSVVRGRAIIEVSADGPHTPLANIMRLLMPKAYAATGTSTVTYNNSGVISFTLNEAAFTASGFTGDILSLGSITMSALDDNTLKVCGGGGNSKCTLAVIRIYTTGAVAGFVNTAGAYGAPIYAGSLNPASPVGLNAAGSVQVQTYTIPGNINRVRLSHFPTPVYAVTTDFSNSGSGAYSTVFVIEYVLQ